MRDREELGKKLREFVPFRTMDSGLLDEAVESMDVVLLSPGDTLVREGERADCVFILLEGRLEVQDAEARSAGERIAELAAGEFVGEVAVLAGGNRSATVTATEPSTVARMGAREFVRMLEKDTDAFALFAARAKSHLRRSQLVRFLVRVLGVLEAGALSDLESEVEWVTVKGGEVLFREGDPPDGVYIVIAGRLGVSVREDGGERHINFAGRGEPIGEMALLSDGPRSATVTASRDSDLAYISNEGFHRLTDRYPSVLKRIAGAVVDRLRGQGARQGRRSRSVITLAVVPVTPRVDVARFSRRLTSTLRGYGETLHLDAAEVDRQLLTEGIAQTPRHEPGSIRLIQWLDEREAECRYVVYEAEPHWSAWTERALRQADHVLWVADARDAPDRGPLELRAERECPSRGDRRSLILLQSTDSGHYPGTERWLGAREVHDHYHVHGEADFQRLGRTLTGHAVGLVLGGGGARGFAHLGVLRALDELGVPIDLIGGTSIGAVIAAGSAMGLDPPAVEEHCRRHFERLFDPTLPVVSLLAGRRIGRQLEEAYGERRIEDLRIPFFCLSTNLTRARECTYRRGALKSAVRASISLPGVLPPVGRDGDVHVDGGLLNNLPIDVMDELSLDGRVIGVDVSPDVDLVASEEMTAEVSGWRVLWRRLNPFAQAESLPHILNVLMRSTVVASIVAERSFQANEDHLILEIPAGDTRLLDFSSASTIAERGYAATRDSLREWWEGLEDHASD